MIHENSQSAAKGNAGVSPATANPGIGSDAGGTPALPALLAFAMCCLFALSPAARADEPPAAVAPAPAQDVAPPPAPAASAEATPPSAPPPAPESDPSARLSRQTDDVAASVGQVIRLVAALAAICAACYFGIRLLGTRFGFHATRPGDLIRVIETKRLDPKTTLYLVEIAGKPTLIGVSEHEVRSLAPLALDDAEIRQALALRDAERGGPRDRKAFARVLAAKLESPPRKEP